MYGAGPRKLSVIRNVLIKVGFPCNIVCGITFQGEDEVLFMEYRKEMKILFDNIAQLASPTFSDITLYRISLSKNSLYM